MSILESGLNKLGLSRISHYSNLNCLAKRIKELARIGFIVMLGSLDKRQSRPNELKFNVSDSFHCLYKSVP